MSHFLTFSPVGTEPQRTTKTADSAMSQAGATNGYTITVTNPNTAAVSLTNITDDLPAGFSYRSGSTSGVTTANPAVGGQTLTWNGPFTVPGGGNVSLHFGVTVSAAAGQYVENAGATASGGATVARTGPTAQVTVGGSNQPPVVSAGPA